MVTPRVRVRPVNVCAESFTGDAVDRFCGARRVDGQSQSTGMNRFEALCVRNCVVDTAGVLAKCFRNTCQDNIYYRRQNRAPYGFSFRTRRRVVFVGQLLSFYVSIEEQTLRHSSCSIGIRKRALSERTFTN